MPDSAVHWFLLFSSLATVSFFCIGLTSYFERRPDRPWWVRGVHDTGMLLSLLQVASIFLLKPRSDVFAGIGILMYTGSVLLFLSAIETASHARVRLQRSFIDHPLPERLLTEGPYRWVRHPFYLGYIIGALVPPVTIDHPVMVVVAGATIAITIVAAFREERVWLSSPRAAAYREYASRTGMFLPMPWRM